MDQLSLESLQALSNSDPKSLDMALLDPLKKQLEAMGEPPPEMADQFNLLKTAIDTLVNEQITRLNSFAQELTDDWDKAVIAKRPVEDRWIDDERQFSGKRRIRDSKAYPGDDKTINEPIIIQATRSKTLMCWGRLADMMLPANDYPIRIDAPSDPDPSEYPQLQQMLQPQQGPDGQPAPPPNPEDVLSQLADQAANEMQATVFQMLRDTKFTSHARTALRDCAKLGTGLLKGPFPTLKQSRKFRPQGQELDVQETPTAGVCRVDPWLFYYDMSPSLDRASATYEVQILSARELAEFKKLPRAITSTIDELLAIPDPKLEGAFRTAVQKRSEQTDMREPLDDVYAVLETHKVIKPDVLKDCLGIEWDHEDMPVIHMWSCNGKCIKFKLSPLERDFRLDYYNFTIMPADDTIFGYGYPYMARGSQRGVDGACTATLANAGAGVAPIFVVSQGKVQPNREQWRMQGLNVFSVENNGDAPLENFFASVPVTSNVEGNLQMVKFFMEQMDSDVLWDQILQGNVNGEEMPASGFVMAANIASVFQKAIAGLADDNVFKPLGERLMWWAKLYNKSAPQGDMDVKAIAATQLVSKDLAMQHAQGAITWLEKPQFAGFSDAYTQAQALISNLDSLPNKDQWLLPRDKAMEAQAKIQQMQSQGDPTQAAKIASDERIAMAKLQNERDMAQSQQQVELLRMQTQMKVAELTLQARLVELQTQKDVDLTAITANIQKASMDDQTTRMTAVLDKQIEARIEMAKLSATPSPYSAKD